MLTAELLKFGVHSEESMDFREMRCDYLSPSFSGISFPLGPDDGMLTWTDNMEIEIDPKER
ncbi:hypothetical protein N7453_011100 [Penicillium expansum]|nr:hypothetical protein N7453_011100 [Penicillium expansum]